MQADDIRVLEQLQCPDLPPYLLVDYATSARNQTGARQERNGDREREGEKKLETGGGVEHAHLVIDAEREDLAAVEDLDGEVGAGGGVARVLDLAEVALPEGAPDLIPPQQRRPRALRLRLALHHSQHQAPCFDPRARAASRSSLCLSSSVCRAR